ncbi:MAG: O-antigen polymerase [Gemmatimonadaceae bacterium]
MSGPTTAALVLSTGLIGWAILMRLAVGTWLQPAAFFPLWWCFAGIAPLILAPNEPVGPNAIVWLMAASVAVSLGGIAGNGGLRTRMLVRYQPATDRELRMFGAVLVVSIVFGTISNIVYLTGSGIPLTEVLNLERLVVVSNQLYVARYAETGAPSPPAISQALLPFVYLAPAVGGTLFILRNERLWKTLCLFSFVPAIIVTILQTTKAAVLFSLSLWLAGYFSARLRFGRLSVFTWPHLLVAAALTSVVTAFFFAIGLARMASTDVALLNIVLVKLVTAAFGHMTVFSQWLAEYTSQPLDPSFGKVTFAGPLEMLGYQQRIPGIFSNAIDLIVGESSNIYTAFRPLIQDFSIPGALLVLALVGFVGGTGFRLVAAGNWSAVPLLIGTYLTVLWSPITWFWIYNSLTATVLAIGLLGWFIRAWRGSRQNALSPGI